MRRLIWLGLFLCAGLAGALVTPRAQEAAPAAGQQPTFRSGVDSVSVDVIVTDKQGRPVTDLTADDFEIRETGKPQTVDTFKFVKIDDGRDDPSADREILSLADQERETARPDNRLFVVFLDDYHVRRGNSMLSRQQIANFLRQLTPHDLVAIATPLSTIAALTFSRNPDVSAGNVAGFVGRKYDYTPLNALEQRYQDLPPEQQEQMRNDMTISALRNVCEFLGSLREGRKSILYVSEGMSGSIPAGARSTGANMQPGSTGVRSDSQAFFDDSSLLLDMQTKVFRSAVRNNVAIYTLDPRGLGNFEFGVEENVSSQRDRQILQQQTDLLRVISDQTDGRAIVNQNNLGPGLRQMVSDSSAYYLLGYTSTLAPRDGKFHEIQVRVKRKDVEVRARKGYWAYTSEEITKASAPVKPGAPSEVTNALDDLVAIVTPGRGHAVSVWMGTERGPTERAVVTLAWELLSGGATDPLDAVDHVTAVATSVTGDELFHGLIARSPETQGVGGMATFNAAPGSVRVRLTPENAKGLRLDSIDAAVDVPDFTATGPQVTTPFLYRGRTARDLQQIRASASPVPVVTPVFSRTERVLMRFAAYGPAGTTPALTLRLLNQGGTPIAALPAPTHTTGDLFESELSFGSFPPGDYVVEIDAVVGSETTKRLLAIRVIG